ncbi:MAG: tRNA epoxyqueuosine(34) reductase QueG [Alkalispirochaeta sp.]
MIVREPWWPGAPTELEGLFREEDIQLIGVTDPEPAAEQEEEYRLWLEEGRQGTMDFMVRHAHAKFRPDRILPGVKAIIFAGLNYYQRRPGRPGGELASGGDSSGLIARYAWGRDYHKEFGKRLKRIARRLAERYPDEQFRAFTDATPLSERHFGERAGIGFTGRHTLLINGAYGSWFFLGEILSTKTFETGEPAGIHHGACPRTCRRCIDVCPTGALKGPHRIDASRCISYLTIEHDGPIPVELRSAMGTWIFGCDLCQEVCPLNVRAQVTDVAGFTKPIAGRSVLLRDILSMKTDEEFLKRFAGSPLMRAGRKKMIRNALIAAGNSETNSFDNRLIPLIREIGRSDDPVLQEHARWALDKLGKIWSEERNGLQIADLDQ